MGSTTWTYEQLRDFEARKYSSQHIQKVLSTPPVKYESDLHNAIIEYCKSKGWQYLHGSMVHKTFRTLGECDFQILASDSRYFLIECKSRTGKLTVEQQAFIAHAERNGHKVHVVRSMDEFREIVK